MSKKSTPGPNPAVLAVAALIAAVLVAPPCAVLSFTPPISPVALPAAAAAASQSPLFRSSSIGRGKGSGRDSPISSLNVVNDVTAQDTSVSDSIFSGESTEPEFNWYKSWYPIIPVEYLDREKPQHFKLLNIDLVVWNDGAVEGSQFGSKKDRSKGAKRQHGTWRVFADSCPHRRAPLSEGRVEDDGTILCSYHAWRWDGDGDLCNVPQAQSSDEFDRIKSNPKSSCNAFPARVVNGLLWVWPESGSDARIESELTEVPIMKLPQEEDASIDEDLVVAGPWNFRELPYGHDYFLENVVDPAHVPSSHHNVVGNRYTGTNSLSMKTIEPVTKDGFAISVEPAVDNGDSPPSTTKYTAPCLVQIKAPVGDAVQILELYSSPSRPGFCNHVGRQVVVKSKSGETPQMLKAFLLPMPKWLNHVLAGLFLNQDALFLHSQERMLHERKEYSTNLDEDEASYNYNTAVLPMSADKGVINFRNWMRNKAGGRIPYFGNPSMPPIDNEVVFDIYNSHTKHCKNCSDALKNLRKARFISYFAAALVAALRPPKLGAIGSTVLAAVLGGLGLGINKLIGAMHRLEYSHAEND
mmetsp:Transcript_7383/g.16464  ORF Transcript_7383/g.16464 Transcript_7383/m.16464 type:complete len:582 (+) Transcript_7383:1-1746(+)